MPYFAHRNKQIKQSMDSAANWGSLEHAQLRQVCSGRSLGSAVNLSNVDQNFDFSGFNVAKGRNGGLFEHNELNRESLLRNKFLLTSIKSPAEEFGHWKPVYDEKSKPAFSLTGTEIWDAHKSDATQKTANRGEWNSADSYTLHNSINNGDSVFANPSAAYDVRLGVKSSGGSDAELFSQLCNRNINQGWGRTPVCQEKPWDLCQDGAILETGAVLPPARLQDESTSVELSQDSSLSFLRAILASGEPVGALGSHSFGPSERLSQLENASKSSGVDSFRLLLELQKLGSTDAASQSDLNQSQFGNLVSSVDGTLLHPGLMGRKNSGFETQGIDPFWIDKRHGDEFGTGSVTRMSSGMQSPSGWSSVSGSEKASVIDDGTSVWSKPEKSVAAEDALSWAKLLKPKTEFAPPPPASAFSVDFSIPPPAFSSHLVSPLEVAPVSNTMSLLGGLYPGSNFPAKSTNVSLAGRGSVSPEITERPWMLQRPQHYSHSQNTNIAQMRAPQTRSKLIQHLVSMGFKKEDVQTALITNNMDLDKSLAELFAKHRAMKAQTEYSVHRAGRLQPILSQHREPVRGSVDGRPCVGAAGFPNALDLSQLMNCQTEWRAGLTNPMQMSSSSVSQLSVSPLPPLSPQNIYPSNCPPGLHQKVAHLDSLAPRGDNTSLGLAESMPWKSLAENEQNSLSSFNVELLKIFGQQIISSASQNQFESAVSAAMSMPSHALLKNGGIVGESLGIASVQNGSLAVDHMGPSMMYSSDDKPKSLSAADLESVESSPLSSVIRLLSDNVTADGDISATDKNSAAPGCFGSSLGGASSKQSLPSALDVKEFIPGVPWKGIRADTSSKQDELDAESGSISAAVAFRDMVRCLAKGEEDTDEGDPALECLPSCWVRLRNVPDKLDDNDLQTLCAAYGKVSVFRDEDGSVLLSYTNPGDASKARSTLDGSRLMDRQLAAEAVGDWDAKDNSGGTSAEALHEPLGYMTPDGLWIPPNSDVAQPYYDDDNDEEDAQDKWYDDVQSGEWQQSEATESFAPSAYEEADDGNGHQ